MGRQGNETRFLQISLRCQRAAVRPFVLHSMKYIQGSSWLRLQISPPYPSSCHFKLCLHPNCLGCVCQWNFFPQKRGKPWQSVLTKEGRAFCRASSSTKEPKLQQALLSQPYCGLVVLWLQFTVQDGSSRQDKTKVKCTQGYIADLGKLLQWKPIWCGISPCHLCITELPG